MKAIIVDDEEASREAMEYYIKKYCPDVEVKGLGASAEEGVKLIGMHDPDIVFLDVEMPFGNAFDMLEQLDDIRFETVFVTAFSNYAIQALNISASYYILKPIDIDELINAVDKIKESRQQNQDLVHTRVLIENIQTANKQLHKVVLPVMDGFEVVQVKDIIHCQANDNFTNFYLVDGSSRMICRTLKFYESLLQEFDFLRVHKSHLVNLQYVQKYKKGKGGQLTMTNGAVIDVSPSKKKELLERF